MSIRKRLGERREETLIVVSQRHDPNKVIDSIRLAKGDGDAG